MAKKHRIVGPILVGAGIMVAIGFSVAALRPQVAMGLADRALEVIGVQNVMGYKTFNFDAVALKRKFTTYGDLNAMPFKSEGEVAVEVSEVPQEIPATLYQTIANWERLDERLSLEKMAAKVPGHMQNHVLLRARIEKPSSVKAKSAWSDPVIVWVGPKNQAAKK